MTFRLRRPVRDALANSNVGYGLADRLRPLAKSSAYQPEHGRVRVVGRRDQELSIELDGKGNVLEVVTPLRRVTRYHYESDKQVGACLPTGLELRTRYDGFGRPVRCERSDGESCDVGYDADGELASIRNGNAPPLRLGRDAERRVTQIVERDGGVVARRYDDEGRLVEVVDPLGRASRMIHRDGPTPVAWIDADGARTDYAYLGPRTEESVAGAPHATYTNDEAGRLAGASYADGYFFAFERDEQGRVTAAKSPAVEVTVEYDEAGRVAAETQNGRTVRYAYDAEGQLVGLVLPDGRSMAYEYDLDGRVSAARDVLGCEQRFGYGAADRPVRRELAGGLVEDYMLDLAGRIAGVELHHGLRLIWAERYQRDELGRVIERSGSRHGGRRYHYDALDRLVAVTTPDSAVRLEAYAYDQASQRVGSLEGATTHDAMCRPLHRVGHTYAYDTRGNRSSDTDVTSTTEYLWTGPNRLAEARLRSGAVVHYEYDAFGRRVVKRTEHATVTYVWAGRQVVQELHESASGSHSVEYLYFPGSHRVLSKCEHGLSYAYHCDHLDTPALLTDTAARIAWSAEYAAFGLVQEESGAVAQPWRFPGQYWDAETRLHYNVARYYDPDNGVYLSRDPLAPAGTNAYVYVGANPINLADPLGLFWESAPGWVKTAVSVAGGIAVGVAVGAAVIALAPAELAIGAVALTAGTVALLAGGLAGGATAGGLDAAMTQGGCVLCGIARGAGIGLLATAPFLLLPATAGYLAFAGAGAASGAIGYLADVATSDHKFSWTGLGESMALGAGLGVAGKFVHGLVEGGGEEPGGGSDEGGGDTGEAPKETAKERLARQRAQRVEEQRQQKLDEGIDEADSSGKLDDLDPEDREFLESDPRNKELAYDPDTKSYKPQEARTARAAEDQGLVKGPVRRAVPSVNPDEAGADYVDGDNNPWDVKDARHGPDNIADSANNGENILVDGSDLSPAERTQLQNDVNQRTANNPNAGDVKVVGPSDEALPADTHKLAGIPPAVGSTQAGNRDDDAGASDDDE